MLLNKKRFLFLVVLLSVAFFIVGCHTPQENQKISSLDDIADKRIGVLLGSVHDTYATKTYPKATILQYKSPPDIVLAVKTGKIDAAFYSTETLAEVLRNDDTIGAIKDRIYSNPIGMGFSQQNDSLREQFNVFLGTIKANGVLADAEKRWFKEGIRTMPVLENREDNGKLIVGIVSDKGLPFAVIENNKIIGFDIELVERFAAYQGKTLVLSDMEFGSLIAAVSSNKIDMIASTLMISEERKKQIDFSDPYYELGASVFALKKNLSGNEETEQNKSTFINSIKDSFYNNIILEDRYLLLYDGLKTTLIISILAVLFGTLLGALICFWRMSRNNLLKTVAKVYISILRGIPVLVLLMLIYYVAFASVDIDPVIVAIFAFGLNFAAYVSEMFRTAIDSIDKGQTEAGIAGGFSRIQTFLYIVMPQAVKQLIPVYKGELISLVKMTSVVGYIAVQDLTKASDIIRSRTFDALFPLVMVAILYFSLAWLLSIGISYIELKSNRKANKRQGNI